LRRLVIGGPEKYDDTFVDWPDTYPHYNVLNENRRPLYEYDPYDYNIRLDVHTYSRQRIWFWDGRIVQVWLSNEKSLQEPIEQRYWYNLLGCTDKWQMFYNREKNKYIYQYLAFGKWHTYWEISHESLYHFAGQSLYDTWLIKNLIEKRNEMRCYYVERIDQTVKIGSGNS
jgi:hypothetical protein